MTNNNDDERIVREEERRRETWFGLLGAAFLGAFLLIFFAERQTSLEQASFDGSKIGGRIFAKAPLLPASFLPLL
jgi:hypothetical protein